MTILPPRTKNKDHIFKNTTVFGRDDNLEWNNGHLAVFKHAYNNVKLYIDAINNSELSMWRYSNINFSDIEISNNLFTASTEPNSFASFFNNNSNTIRSKLEFNETGRFITYKDQDSEIRTLNKYDGTEKSNIPTEYKNLFKDYSYSGTNLRFEILKFSQWGAANFGSFIFTSSKKIGQIGQMIEVEVDLKDTNQEGVEGAPVYFTKHNGMEIDIFHTHGDYSLTDVNGKAKATINLKKEGIVDLRAEVDSPVQYFTRNNLEILCVTEETEIYVRGVSYKTFKFFNDLKELMSHIEQLFESVENFSFQELGATQASVIKSNSETYEDIMIFMKKATIDGHDYLTELQAENLRTKLISKLQEDLDINFLDVEVRSYRRFINLRGEQ